MLSCFNRRLKYAELEKVMSKTMLPLAKYSQNLFAKILSISELLNYCTLLSVNQLSEGGHSSVGNQEIARQNYGKVWARRIFMLTPKRQIGFHVAL